MEKSIYNIDENGLSYGRGYVYSLQYHIVWCTKYRRKVLTAGADEDCKQLLLDLAEEYGFRIPAMEVMPDHVHVLIDAKPQFYISDMVKIMKGTLARRLFLLEEYIRSQKEKAWGGKGRPPRDLERLQRYHREVLDADHAVSRNGDAGKQQLPEDHSDVSS